MIRRRKLRGRSARYPRRWPVVAGWSAGAAAAAAVPVGIAYLHGRPPQANTGQMREALSHAIAQAVPSIALTTAAVIAFAWCVRRLLLETLAYRPGRIEVGVFARGPDVDADAEQLTMMFRERLATLRLSAPNVVPGPASDGDFLDVLGREKLDTGNIAGSIVALLRAAIPTHAWQVSGLLVKRTATPSCGVALQVAQLPHNANPPETVWADDFEEAVRIAGDHATAAVVPRTRLCREPWSAWKHFLLPGDLLSALEEGVRLESERRYDEALDSYYRASTYDPMNMVLRLNIGQLQEKLGLYIDALMTYVGMIAVSRDGPVLRPFAYRRAARSQRQRAIVAARYRRIVLLGGAELAEQWRRTGPSNRRAWSARDERRVVLRDWLRRSLAEQLAQVDAIHTAQAANQNADPGRALPLESLRRRGETAPHVLLAEEGLGTQPSQRAEERARFEFRELLALLALHELEKLPFRWLRSRDQRILLTPAAAQLTRMCIEERLAWIQSQLAPGSAHGEAAVWPPRPERLEARIRGIEGRGRFGRWHEHYNAACAHALPLLAEPGPMTIANPVARLEDEALRARLAEFAVARLARATSCADSGYIAGRREWLVSEDPDLDGLRHHPRFREFEATYFPSEGPTPPRPRHVRQIESARYIRDLLAETANRWELEWHRRGRELDKSPDVHVMLDWWRTELRVWALVRQVAIDRRHWPARVELMDAMRAWARDYGFPTLDVAFHRYEDQPLCDAYGALLCDDGQDLADLADRRMAAIYRTLPDPHTRTRARALLRALERWQSTLRQLDIDGRAPDRVLLAALCDSHAALWQLLHEWLNAEAPGQQEACRVAFVRQITRHDEAIAARVETLTANGRPRPRGGAKRTPTTARAGGGGRFTAESGD